MRWFTPPPTVTAYFWAKRKPGMVLRVSTMAARVPLTASTKVAVLLATAESNCRKLSTVRSAVSKARAGPCKTKTT